MKIEAITITTINYSSGGRDGYISINRRPAPFGTKSESDYKVTEYRFNKNPRRVARCMKMQAMFLEMLSNAKK